MNLYLQHGYGKGQKLSTLASSGSLRGVILSPADEEYGSLERTVLDARSRGLRVYIDPQAYVYSTTPRGLGRKHESHDIQFDDLHWSQGVDAIIDQIARVGAMHEKLNPDGVRIAPTVLQASFDDVWTPTAFQLARTASSEWGRDKTVATLAIDEGALDTWRQVDTWLDVATTLDVRGFYVLVGRSDAGYPPAPWSSERLANLLRLIYVLSELNGYEVCWGYSDGEGLAGLAAGASALAAGWNYSLRQFKPSKWQPVERKGGAQPNVRFYAQRLWSPLLAAVEADSLYSSELRDRVFTAQDQEYIRSQPLTEMGVVDAQLQYLRSLSQQASLVASAGGVSEKLDYVESSLLEAEGSFASIERLGIPLTRRYSSRVAAILESIRTFRAAESL
ncbi:hypothetical protein [Rathayibacter sp. AY1A5]|uniref:hypothetical protein n=1 Tax=Rathayibacter sp. AY1A5 TaxID=2080523 RepID=UPI0011B0F1CF|nr:hypothetical protein [Rathayibacter sp. AY1A5]